MSYQGLMVEIKRLPDEEQEHLLNELMQLLKQKRNTKTNNLDLREGFFEDVFGSLKGEPITRAFKGDFETRDVVL